MDIATRERHIIFYTEGLCHTSRDAALRRFHASRRGRAGCLFHLGIIFVFQSQWDRRAIGEACSISSPFPFSWTNRADEVAQTDFSALARLWSIPAGGDDGAVEAFPRALAMPVTHTLGPLQPKPRSSAPENAVRCMCSCSALHLPSQRAAYAHAARCVFCLTVGRVIRQRIPSPYRCCSITPWCVQR